MAATITIPETMDVFKYYPGSKNLVKETVPVPKPGPGEGAFDGSTMRATVADN